MTTLPNKTVTAILPNYNYADFFVQRLEDVTNQSYPVSEIIILDDASTDGSVPLIRRQLTTIGQKYPGIKLQHSFNTTNSGNVFSQWQRGIGMATSDYIWICELDDSSSTDFLENVMAGFATPDVVLSYSNSKIIDSAGRTLIKESLRQVKDVVRRKHKPGGYIIDGKVEVDKNLAVFNSIPNVSAVVFKKISELDTFIEKAKQFRLSGDWFFYLQLAASGKIAYCNKKLNFHRLHQGSVTEQTDYEERLKELRQIHQYAKKSFQLSATTQSRMESLEQQLQRKWL